ncbi:MAG: hypothetical protein WCG14_00265 [Chlamydiia bacterium]
MNACGNLPPLFIPPSPEGADSRAQACMRVANKVAIIALAVICVAAAAGLILGATILTGGVFPLAVAGVAISTCLLMKIGAACLATGVLTRVVYHCLPAHKLAEEQHTVSVPESVSVLESVIKSLQEWECKEQCLTQAGVDAYLTPEEKTQVIEQINQGLKSVKSDNGIPADWDTKQIQTLQQGILILKELISEDTEKLKEMLDQSSPTIKPALLDLQRDYPDNLIVKELLPDTDQGNSTSTTRKQYEGDRDAIDQIIKGLRTFPQDASAILQKANLVCQWKSSVIETSSQIRLAYATNAILTMQGLIKHLDAMIRMEGNKSETVEGLLTPLSTNIQSLFAADRNPPSKTINDLAEQIQALATHYSPQKSDPNGTIEGIATLGILAEAMKKAQDDIAQNVPQFSTHRTYDPESTETSKDQRLQKIIKVLEDDMNRRFIPNTNSRELSLKVNNQTYGINLSAIDQGDPQRQLMQKELAKEKVTELDNHIKTLLEDSTAGLSAEEQERKTLLILDQLQQGSFTDIQFQLTARFGSRVGTQESISIHLFVKDKQIFVTHKATFEEQRDNRENPKLTGKFFYATSTQNLSNPPEKYTIETGYLP